MVLQRKWKIAALLMAFVLLLAMAAAGCADNESQEPNEAKEPANKKVILATPPALWYRLTGWIASHL